MQGERHVAIANIDAAESFNKSTMEQLEQAHKPGSVLIEFNGMWNPENHAHNTLSESLVYCPNFDDGQQRNVPKLLYQHATNDGNTIQINGCCCFQSV